MQLIHKQAHSCFLCFLVVVLVLAVTPVVWGSLKYCPYIFLSVYNRNIMFIGVRFLYQFLYLYSRVCLIHSWRRKKGRKEEREEGGGGGKEGAKRRRKKNCKQWYVWELGRNNLCLNPFFDLIIPERVKPWSLEEKEVENWGQGKV